MNKQETASEHRSRRLSQWKQAIQERDSSGLSVREYCRRTHIKESTYYYRQRKLQESACRELACREFITQSKPAASSGMAPDGWIAYTSQSEIAYTSRTERLAGTADTTGTAGVVPTATITPTGIANSTDSACSPDITAHTGTTNPTAPTGTTSRIVIEVGAYRVAVEPDFNTDTLTKVCRILVSLC